MGDDRFFGGKPGAAARARAAMRKTYGERDGEHVYRAKIAKAKRRVQVPRPKR